MSRLASIASAGYYPIHPQITSQIAQHLSAPHGGRIYDPCCGKGVALVQLASSLCLEPFGNELQRSRAEESRTAVNQYLAQRNGPPIRHRDKQATRIFWSPMQQMSWSRGGFNLLYLNPPYDQDETEGRLERLFLKQTRPALCADGVLVWVVPQIVLAFRAVAEYIASHFHDVRVVAHAADHRHFNEITLFGVHNSRATQPDDATVDHLRAIGRSEVEIPTIDNVDSFVYTLPKVPVSAAAFKFWADRVYIEDVLRETRKRGVLTSAEFQQHVAPQTSKMARFRPMTPLRRGHLVNVIAAGMLNNQLLTHENGETLFIKGQTYKAMQRSHYRDYDSDDEGYTEVTTETERFETRIVTLAPDGTIERRDGSQLEAFLKQWIVPLTKAVTRQYKPVYQFDQNGYADVLQTLNQARIIPNTNGLRGLLPAQQHAVAAIATRLDKRHLDAKDAILIGQMGVGKTIMGPAVAACIEAKRIIVMCPPHLTAKWEREIRHVIPNVRVMQLKKISDVDAFFAQDASIERPVYGVMKETSARAGSGWEHCYQWCGGVRHKSAHKRKKLVVEYDSALVRMAETGNWVMNSQTVVLDVAGREQSVTVEKLLTYVRQMRGPRAPNSGIVLSEGDRPKMPRDFGRKQNTVRPSTLDYEPLYQYTRRYAKGKRGLTMREALQRQDKLRANIQLGHDAYSPLAPHPLSPAKPDGWAKWPLATYILKRYKGQTDLLLVDEAHEMKGHDSDRGYAFGRLINAAKKVLSLTGTIYGGKASTLFSLLYRMSHTMQRTYGHRDIARWTKEYGVLQEVERVRFDADGQQTGNSRSNVTVKELPGASPAMMRWLLDRSVFVSLEDLGFALPNYKEEPILLDMSPAMQAQYDVLHATLKTELKEMLIRNDRSLLAAYLQALLSWPDSPWRPKMVRHPRSDSVVAYIPGLPTMPVGVAPKESAILRKIQSEIAANRKVLLLCQQTATLDITPQWKDLLERHNIRTAILTCKPAKREAWIEAQSERGTQVILSHPRRVQTGLDIIDFSTIIWMGTEYSVYTVKQASRRSYRIGQTEDVTVQFYAYRGTLQEQALRLVAAKMAATDRIDGNTIATDSLTELDSMVQGDLITTLARIVVGEEALTAPSLADAFADANGALRENLAYLGVAAGPIHMPTTEMPDIVLPMERLLITLNGGNSNSLRLGQSSTLLNNGLPKLTTRPRNLLELLRGA